MGITRERFRLVPVTLTYYLADTETGKMIEEPVEARFVFRRPSEKEAIAAQADQVFGSEYGVVDYLASLLDRRPTGLDDWPDEGTIEEQFQSYFRDPVMRQMVNHIDVRFADQLYPKEFFRSIQPVRLEARGALETGGQDGAGVRLPDVQQGTPTGV